MHEERRARLQAAQLLDEQVAKVVIVTREVAHVHDLGVLPRDFACGRRRRARWRGRFRLSCHGGDALSVKGRSQC